MQQQEHKVTETQSQIIDGMSLRDWFAGQVLNAEVARVTHRNIEGMAMHAYDVADTMLKVRSRVEAKDAS